MSDLKPLLIEIGHEELPAAFVKISMEGLRGGIVQVLREKGFIFEKPRSYGTPRRTSVLFDKVSATSQIKVEEILGPPVRVAYDDKGNPTKALLKFAEKVKVRPEELKVKKTKKGEYIVARVEKGGEKLEDVLGKSLKDVLLGIPFPKTMRWQGSLKFARPIRWLVVMYGDEVLPLSLDGIDATNVTYGNRLTGNNRIVIKNPLDYVELLRKEFVIVELEERVRMVKDCVYEAAQKVGGKPAEDEELVEEVANLVEYPRAILGGFDTRFLKLPAPVVVTAMKQHQRNFAVYSPHDELMPYFVGFIYNRFAPEDVVW
jgi:glycyl-tRNA synthetase beta chain